MQCPHEHGELRQTVTPNGTGWVCPVCAGIWVERKALAESMRRRSPRPAAGTVPPTPPPRAGLLAHRPCPQCAHHALVQRQVGPVEIDVCPSCKGLWCDAGEWETIIRLRQAGALAVVGAGSSANDTPSQMWDAAGDLTVWVIQEGVSALFDCVIENIFDGL